MGGQLVPAEYWAIPGWRNAFENTAAVQFHHRVLAVSTLTAVTITWLQGCVLVLPPRTRLLMHLLMLAAAGQASLGVATLLNHVPPDLGVAHQVGGLTLFSIALALTHSLRVWAGPSVAATLVATVAALAATGGVAAVATDALPLPSVLQDVV